MEASSMPPGGETELEDRLVAQALAAGDPAGWFEHFYRASAAGEVELPWNRAEPHRLLTRWAAERGLDGSGRRAIVVGCGQGADAEYVARLGFQVVAFDIAETAIRLARQRYPDSAVRYQAADLLDLPGQWLRAFDLAVEIITVQALPDPPQRQAMVNVGRLVGQGGTLFAVEAFRREHRACPRAGALATEPRGHRRLRDGRPAPRNCQAARWSGRAGGPSLACRIPPPRAVAELQQRSGRPRPRPPGGTPAGTTTRRPS